MIPIFLGFSIHLAGQNYGILIPWLPTRLTFPWCYFGSAGWRHHLGAMAMAMAAMVGESLILALGYP